VQEESPLCFSSDPIVCNLSARALLMKHMEAVCSYGTRASRYLLLFLYSARVPDTWSGALQVTVNIGRLEAFHFVSLIGNEYFFLKGALHYLSKYNPLTYRIRDRHCWHAD
jgi:hypothetical protein